MPEYQKDVDQNVWTADFSKVKKPGTLNVSPILKNGLPK